jgi:putative spermidine/putrescine transport system permease protein
VNGRRGPAYWLLAASSRCSCCSSTGPTLTILVLSLPGPAGGLTFPMNGVSVHWFKNLFEKQMVGDFAGSLQRSMILGVAVHAGDRGRLVLGRPRLPHALRGSGTVFYLAIASLIVPSILISLGIGLLVPRAGHRTPPGTARPSARISPGPCRSGC